MPELDGQVLFCPGCGKRLVKIDELVGNQVSCGRCQQDVRYVVHRECGKMIGQRKIKPPMIVTIAFPEGTV